MKFPTIIVKVIVKSESIPKNNAYLKTHLIFLCEYQSGSNNNDNNMLRLPPLQSRGNRQVLALNNVMENCDVIQ